MNVYIWTDVLIDYTEGMMVAIAPSVEIAREELLKVCNHLPDYDLTKEPREFKLTDTEPAAFVCWGGS